jgi:hypothetical protein
METGTVPGCACSDSMICDGLCPIWLLFTPLQYFIQLTVLLQIIVSTVVHYTLTFVLQQRIYHAKQFNSYWIVRKKK